MDRKSDDMRTDNPKRDDSILPIEMWYRRECKDQGVGVRKALNIIQKRIMRL